MAKSMAELASYARKKANEHHKYKRGGWSWTTGIECHGFTGRVYKDCGYEGIYKRIHKKGFWKAPWKEKYLGKWLHKKKKSGLTAKDLLPGDILYTSFPGSHHSAIYIGQGQVAEAGGKCTKVASLTNRRSKFKYCFRITEPGKTKTAKKAQKKVAKKAKKAQQQKINEKIAKEVMAGKWGNDPERRKRLKAAGYDAKAIQKIVNRLSK